MRRVAALALCLMLAFTAAAEAGFTFRNGVTWDMSLRQVLDAEANPSYTNYGNEPMRLIQIEGVQAAGLEANVFYGFLEHQLVIEGYGFTDGVDSIDLPALAEAVSCVYGNASQTQEDIGRFMQLTDVLYGENWADRTAAGGTFYCWDAPDDTLILLTNAFGTVELAYVHESAILNYKRRQDLKYTTDGL